MTTFPSCVQFRERSGDGEYIAVNIEANEYGWEGEDVDVALRSHPASAFCNLSRSARLMNND